MTRLMRFTFGVWLAAGLAPGLAAAAEPPRVGDVLSVRTAGQPERQVRVTALPPDAEGFADVLDLGTGARYSLPARLLGRFAKVPLGEVREVRRAKPPAARPTITAALSAAPALAPARTNGWPAPGTTAVAGSRFPTTTAWPGIRATPQPDVLSAAPPVSTVRGLLRLDAPPLELAAGVGPRPLPPAPGAATPVGERPATPRPVPVASEPPVRPNPIPSLPPVTPNSVAALPQAAPAVVASGLPPTQPSYSTVAMPPGVAPEPRPPLSPAAAPAEVASTGLPPTQPSYSTVVMPPMVAPAIAPTAALTAAAPRVTIQAAPTPPSVAERAGPRVAVARAAAPAEREPLASTFAMTPTPPARRAAEGGAFVEVATEPAPPPPAAPVTHVALARLPDEPVGLAHAGRLAPAEDQADPMAEEIRPFVEELANALRPSLRARAASALADGRYGSRAEVKSILAQVALTDPAPEVRAHCIDRLSRLGYHESAYLAYLDACADSGHAAVRGAAVEALARLTNRNR